MNIQVSIGGFAAQATTIIGQLNERTGVLVLVKEVKYRETRIPQKSEQDPVFALVSNLDLPDLDFRFEDTHVRDAIRSYFTRKSQMTLDIVPDQGLQRHMPDMKIEMEKVDEGGRRYRVAPDITNGQIAILAAVAFVDRQQALPAAISMADELADFYRVQSI